MMLYEQSVSQSLLPHLGKLVSDLSITFSSLNTENEIQILISAGEQYIFPPFL